jgi:NitT/TauT family transport system substrate-binding protein
MPQLLNTHQIDAIFVWQPYVAMANQGGIGKAIVYSEDLPPNHRWADTPCCVLVMADRFIEQEPAHARMISMLTTAAIQYINDYPEKSEVITSNWLFGSGGYVLIAGKYLDPLHIETESFPTLRFTNVSTAGYLSNLSAVTPHALPNTGIVMPGSPTGLAVSGKDVKSFEKQALPLIRFGYLSSDHHAPLFVLAKDPAYFKEHYGLALVPVSPGEERPNQFNLLSGNETVAQVQLSPGQSGGGLMTNMGQGAIDVAYLGSVPANLQITLGNPAQVIQPLHTGGSALVVSNNTLVSDWNDFAAWAHTRSDAKKPLVVATVQSSIQETMIRDALQTEGFEVRLYGT